MDAKCPYCPKPLFGNGPLVRVGPGQHAHRGCRLRAENEEGHFVDAPCVQCNERLSRCLCCPGCGGREHSNGADCETCAYYQIRRGGPDPAFAARNIDDIVGHAVDEGVIT